MPAVPIGVDMPMGDRRPIGVRRPMGVRRPKDKISRSRVAFTENETVLYWVNSLLQQWWFSASKKDRCYYKSGVVSHWKWNHSMFNSQSNMWNQALNDFMGSSSTSGTEYSWWDAIMCHSTCAFHLIHQLTNLKNISEHWNKHDNKYPWFR